MDEATEQKFGVVDDRLEHLEHRAGALEARVSDRAARRREWIVIWLIVVELLMLVPIAPAFLRWLWRVLSHA